MVTSLLSQHSPGNPTSTLAWVTKSDISLSGKLKLTTRSKYIYESTTARCRSELSNFNLDTRLPTSHLSSVFNLRVDNLISRLLACLVPTRQASKFPSHSDMIIGGLEIGNAAKGSACSSLMVCKVLKPEEPSIVGSLSEPESQSSSMSSRDGIPQVHKLDASHTCDNKANC